MKTFKFQFDVQVQAADLNAAIAEMVRKMTDDPAMFSKIQADVFDENNEIQCCFRFIVD